MVAGERREPAEHRPPLDWIEAVGRLVEDHHPRVVDDGRGERDLLFHPDRERLHRAVALLAGVAPVEHLVGTAERLDPGDPRELCRVAHHLHAGQARHGAFVLRDDADIPPHGMGLAARIEPEHAHVPLGEPHEPEDRLDERALAGAVGTNEPGDARMNGERHAVEDGALPVPLDDPRGLHRLFHGRQSAHACWVPGRCRLDPSSATVLRQPS